MHHTSVGSALALTSMGAAGTALGGLLVVAQPQMSFRRLGALQVGIAS
jgi:ZIP family zinc transporter